ncbi:MAG TPA: PQQ-dependent sugar dehydrogenase [Aggregatilineales bacterium]|nr:PQQ-dependent sugar dehydrogenase [Anaerolineales bacterium]HRE47042.1 PQQ-dependent sugar dehydrogenase [Aggregatilineales bacterium]
MKRWTRFFRLTTVALLGAVVFTLTFTTLWRNALADVSEPAIKPPPLKVNFTLDTREVLRGYTLPLYLTHAGDGSERLFILEKVGRIQIAQAGKPLATPYLDISAIVGSTSYEQGLLGLAFHPEYRTNGLFYVNYTNKEGNTIVAEYRVSTADPNRADPNSGRTLLTFTQPFPNHNGGMVAFGADGYLYIGVGDGGSAGDPLRAGQDSGTWLGKILRIDVSGMPYTIPPSNPYADGKDGLPEIWSLGWRNPWRFSFDRMTGDLYVGDVGQNAYEEVHLEKAGSPGGLNYGWNIMEGLHCFRAAACDKSGLVMPIAEYDHGEGISITGGYVYRGEQFPALQGYYFFGDFGSTKIWALKANDAGAWEMSEVLQPGFPISSFGEDEAGELYVVDFGGKIHQLIAK